MSPASAPLVYPFSYFSVYGNGPIKGNHTRDDKACAKIVSALCSQGFEEGPTVFNRPPSKKELAECGGNPPILAIDEVCPRPGDRVVLTTRLPISDEEQIERIRVARGFTSWEAPVEDCLRLVCDICSRSHFRLLEWVAAELPEAYANRADMYFRVYRDAYYKHVQTLRAARRREFRGEPRTMAFLLHLESVEALGRAGILIAFGMGGEETLGWAHLLQNGYSHLLATPGFVMAELSNAVVPERPTSLRYIEDWKVDVVLQIAAERLERVA